MRGAKSESSSQSDLAGRWSLSSSFGCLPGMTSFFLPVSYSSQPPTTCNEWLGSTYPGCGSYRWCGAECRYVQDSLTTTAGNYFLGQGAALCETVACPGDSGNQPCTNTYRTTWVKNTCSGGAGGGGGGGGGLEDFNNGYGESCSSDWDCDFGYTCDWGTNTCQ